MRIPALLLLVAISAFGYDPADKLYEKGIKLVEQRKLKAARSTFETLIETHPRSPRAFDARGALDAVELFEEGHDRLKAGQYGTAMVAFQTLISVYPECALVRPAGAALLRAAAMEQDHPRVPMVRAVRFENLQPLTAADIMRRFDEREVGPRVERPYDAREVDDARAALTQMLAEKGKSGAQVEADVREVASRRMEVIFRGK
jgi:hypothetical protein